MQNPVINATKKIRHGVLSQSQGILTLQAYSNSALQQQLVDFSSIPSLSENQKKINDGLSRAKDHASNYLNNVQPLIINNIASIRNYYLVHQSITTSIPVNVSNAEFIKILRALREQAYQYYSDTKNNVSVIQNLYTSIAADAANFAQATTELNGALNGDHGVLAHLNSQIQSLDGKIAGSSVGTAASGLLVIGGLILTIIGAAAAIPTGGATTALVLGGTALILLGAVGSAASVFALSTFVQEKNNLLTIKDYLCSEVRLVAGLLSGYKELQNQAQSAVTASIQMQNAWEFLNDDLDNLIGNLSKGITTAGITRNIFITSSNASIHNLLEDVRIIESQLSGTRTTIAPKDVLLQNYIPECSKK